MTDVTPSISDIRESVQNNLSEYFLTMSSGEFEGAGIFPPNALDVTALYLSVSANHPTESLISSFNLSGKDDLATEYMNASQMISKDDHLVMQVSGLARDLGISADTLVL